MTVYDHLPNNIDSLAYFNSTGGFFFRNIQSSKSVATCNICAIKLSLFANFLNKLLLLIKQLK